jgi:hypothetical protein
MSVIALISFVIGVFYGVFIMLASKISGVDDD